MRAFGVLQSKIFPMKFCLALCLITLILTFIPQSANANEDNKAILQELKALREEVAQLKDICGVLIFMIDEDQSRIGRAVEKFEEQKKISEVSSEAADITLSLRLLKAAALMFYADHTQESDETLEAVINSDDSVQALLAQYLDNPEKYSREYHFRVAKVDGIGKWFVGLDVLNKSNEVKQRLQEKASSVGLISEAMEPYAGGNFVFMVVR